MTIKEQIAKMTREELEKNINDYTNLVQYCASAYDLNFLDALYYEIGFRGYNIETKTVIKLTESKKYYQPNMDCFPDDLASFEAYSSIEKGREDYPDIAVENWDEYEDDDIEGVVILK